jgi:inorganic triphosphatase YgiF
MQAHEGREIELKLGLAQRDVARLRQLRVIRDRALARPVKTRLETTYFDTPDLDLFRRQVFAAGSRRSRCPSRA